MEPDQTRSSMARFRIGLAGILALLYLAAVIPSTGRIVADNSTTPVTYHIMGRPQQIIILLGFVMAPFACVLFGTRHSRLLECIGWIAYASLLFQVLLMGQH